MTAERIFVIIGPGEIDEDKSFNWHRKTIINIFKKKKHLKVLFPHYFHINITINGFCQVIISCSGPFLLGAGQPGEGWDSGESVTHVQLIVGLPLRTTHTCEKHRLSVGATIVPVQRRDHARADVQALWCLDTRKHERLRSLGGHGQTQRVVFIIGHGQLQIENRIDQ